MPKMTHPDASGPGKTIDVAPDSVAMYASQGWQTKPAAPAKKATAKKAAAKPAAKK